MFTWFISILVALNISLTPVEQPPLDGGVELPTTTEKGGVVVEDMSGS